MTKDGHDILAGDRLKYKATAKSLVRRLLKVDPDHAYAVVRWPAQEAATTPKADAPPGATLCEVQRPVDRLRRVRWGSLTMTRGPKMD
ncbi:MAG TPA: hypothetical protein VHF22_14420, partial [Planctomycetota bacterium]|nr:hypothetical protein [Planctomycetota bacterium]